MKDKRTEYLESLSAKEQDELLSAMTPEARAQFSELLGRKSKPVWETLGISRATYYRNRKLAEDAMAQGMDPSEAILEAFDRPAALRKRLGKPTVNQKEQRANASLQALDDTNFAFTVLVETMRRYQAGGQPEVLSDMAMVAGQYLKAINPAAFELLFKEPEADSLT